MDHSVAHRAEHSANNNGEPSPRSPVSKIYEPNRTANIIIIRKPVRAC